SQSIAAFGQLACESISLFAKNVADAFTDGRQVFADLCLGFIDHRAQGRAAAGEGLSDFTGASDEIFVDLTRAGLKGSIEFFSAAVEGMCTGFELGQKRAATFGERAFEIGEA